MIVTVPRRIKSFCERFRETLTEKRRAALACLIVKDLKLPENVKLVVLADESFEGGRLTNLCRKKGYAFIAPADSERTFEPRRKLHARGKALAREAHAADVEWITDLAGSRKGRSQAGDLLPELKIPA